MQLPQTKFGRTSVVSQAAGTVVAPLRRPARSGAGQAGERPTNIEAEMGALVGTLLPMIDQRGGLVVHITSSTPGEGTSTIARGLANAADSLEWGPILLLDATGSPPLSGALEGGAGLLERFAASGPFEPGVQDRFGHALWTAALTQPGGAQPRTEAMRSLYAWARAKFVLTVVDCPPILASGGHSVLPSLADGTVLVVEADSTRIPVVQRARDMLTGTGAEILGVVLNKREDFIPPWLYRFV